MIRRRAAALVALALAVLAALSTLVAGAESAGAPRARARPPHHLTRPAPSAPRDRYSLVHGCYTVRSGGRVVGADGPYRMQATALGRYLLLGTHRTYLAGGFRDATAPGPATVWTVSGDSREGFRMVAGDAGPAVAVGFSPASGCAVYPEGGIGASGRPFAGSAPQALVSGTIDAHTHVTAFEFLGGDFHCGRPWHPYGIPFALPDCVPYEQGTNGVIQSFLDYGAPAHPHDTRGWPTFRDWPSPTDLAEEGDYYTGLQRAWMAGLRLMVTQLVDNEALCTIMTTRRNPCNDMAAVRLQARDLRALQDYIDAQAGGPGKGFLRIVTDPFQARQVINAGKLAVVEGIEVSHLFNCGEYLGVPQCDRGQIDAGLREVRGLGVSTFFPIHKFDNAFGGTKMDSGETGLLVNGGNHLETGHFWDVKTCTGPEHDSTQVTLGLTGPTGGGLGTVIGRVGPSLLGPTTGPGKLGLRRDVGSPLASQVPVYPPPPHCNQRGLTALGSYLINAMIAHHFIVELDHMDAKTADAALAILEAHRYSGVVSAHSWDSPQENPRIYNLGGFITPIAGASPPAFVDQWRASLKIRNRRFFNGTGFGYGADMNGLAEQSQPSAATPITYPFRSFHPGVTFSRETWGQRTFDINRDGVANYGMYADWLQELTRIAGRPIVADMFNGAEAYLQMWERAFGVSASGCPAPPAILSPAGAGKVRLGANLRELLLATGQPRARSGSTYGYCLSGRTGTPLRTVFDARGRIGAISATAPGFRAGGVAVGAPAATVRRLAAPLAGAPEVWLANRPTAGTRFVYRLAHGRVAGVGVIAGRDRGAAATLARAAAL